MYITKDYFEVYDNNLDHSNEADGIPSPEVTSSSSSLPVKKKYQQSPVKRSPVSTITHVATPIAVQQTLVPALKAAILFKQKKIVKKAVELTVL